MTDITNTGCPVEAIANILAVHTGRESMVADAINLASLMTLKEVNDKKQACAEQAKSLANDGGISIEVTLPRAITSFEMEMIRFIGASGCQAEAFKEKFPREPHVNHSSNYGKPWLAEMAIIHMVFLRDEICLTPIGRAVLDRDGGPEGS